MGDETKAEEGVNQAVLKLVGDFDAWCKEVVRVLAVGLSSETSAGAPVEVEEEERVEHEVWTEYDVEALRTERDEARAEVAKVRRQWADTKQWQLERDQRLQEAQDQARRWRDEYDELWAKYSRLLDGGAA